MPRISVRSFDCHSLTMSLGSFFLNMSKNPISIADQPVVARASLL